MVVENRCNGLHNNNIIKAQRCRTFGVSNQKLFFIFFSTYFCCKSFVPNIWLFCAAYTLYASDKAFDKRVAVGLEE